MIAELPDGGRIELRPIRPEDRAELAAGMRGMSPESRYRRFLSLTDELGEEELDYLTNVDHHDHEAVVAADPDTGAGVGVARFVRLSPGSEVAELAVAVADEWQGRGVGGALLARLCERARDEGIGRFSALILSSNRAMLELFDDLGDVRVTGRDHGSVELEVELAPDGVGPGLGETMRAAARGDIDVGRHGPGARGA